MRARRINVHILAQQVDTDGTPLGTDGQAFGRKWRSNVEWVRRPLSVNGFCPKTVDVGYRTVFYENYPHNPQAVLCVCHEKVRLIGSKIMIGGYHKDIVRKNNRGVGTRKVSKRKR